jgi:hypothetical protein
MEEFLLYRETLYSVSMQYSESCGEYFCERVFVESSEK